MITGAMATLLLAPLTALARPATFFVRRAPMVVVHPGFAWGWGPLGALKFDAKDKSAEVYVNGAYAGTVGESKTMHLQPGSYDIEVREQGRTQLDQNVYIAAGKTLHLNPDQLQVR